MKQVTILISPRDRYTGAGDCIETLYANTDISDFDLVILDLGYPRNELKKIKDAISKKTNAKIVNLGRIIPMEGIRNIRSSISTPYTVLLDNDSRVTKGWLEPLIETAEQGAAFVSPLVLEKAGVDEGASLRNHIYTSEVRVVDVYGEPYLIEHKPFRRTVPNEIPKEIAETQLFELHCVLFNTQVLKTIELPQMTIREHIDIGMQLRALGQRTYADPRSVILFDNLGTRASFGDLKYFNLRWNSKITFESSRLFENRWGYKFYSEQAIYNWAFRRRIFLLLRWMYIPIPLCNKIDRVVNKIKTMLVPIWDPLPNPIEDSKLYYDTIESGKPNQLTHQIS